MGNNATGDSGKKQGFWAKTVADAKKATEDAETRALQAREPAGNLVTKQSFGGSTIEIYDGGYVRVAAFISKTTPYEKLMSIKHSFQVQDKSAGGRALAGMATVGLNYLASNEKRTVFLTLVTDKRVHSLKATGGMARSADKTALGLEVAGRGVLGGLAAPTAATPVAAPKVAAMPAKKQDDVIEQIKRLGELHAAGVLSDEEFTLKKTDLLDRI
ncbi:SHOCT domain-containing protein [Nesterenkonia sandarakina]|uniref:Putative oligomerization/nucleic acid binding protein n=1 Tax=Nesterenkonia sandarakina TaxID=272918 RepID=A0A2T0YBU4_9MICC|nr:SHOCT domain-containing protein [Nesterenkonia sandarakina]PRZ12219.1 putative oligomerization/nucleic acid binding protein [Nesterenkonia sandarakina]